MAILLVKTKNNTEEMIIQYVFCAQVTKFYYTLAFYWTLSFCSDIIVIVHSRMNKEQEL